MSAAAGDKAVRVRRLSGHKKPHVDEVRPDINVTPLVDVMLVLLIIFMLMTLVMGRGHEVQVPLAKNFSMEKDKMQPVVSIDPDGFIYVEKNKLGPINESTLKEMHNQVQAAWTARPEIDQKIYLKADSKVPYSVVYPALEYMNRTMGLASVDLAVGEQQEK
jgi:biopolymer transport protein TolR